MIKVKICGITNLEDAQTALAGGADALGFNFYAKSPRCITVAEAQTIVRQLAPGAWFAGVFVNHSRREVEEIARRVALDTLQFHGDEDAEYCTGWGEWRVIKAIRAGPGFAPETLSVCADSIDHFLFDHFEESAFGGTGKEITAEVLETIRNSEYIKRSFLSGGLTTENVGERIAQLRPFGVDVASGVEACPGKKDPELVRSFIKAAKSV